MALDREKYLDSMIAISQKKQQIIQINLDRNTAEKAFVIDKQINELNAQRTALSKTYDDQVAKLSDEITALEQGIFLRKAWLEKPTFND